MRDLWSGRARLLTAIVLMFGLVTTLAFPVAASPGSTLGAFGARQQEATPDLTLPDVPPENPSRWIPGNGGEVTEPEVPVDPAPEPDEVVTPVEEPSDVITEPSPGEPSGGEQVPPQEPVTAVVEPNVTDEASPEAEQAQPRSASLAAEEEVEAQDEPLDPTEYLFLVCNALDGDGDGYVTPQEVFFGVFFGVIPGPDVDPFLFVVLLGGGCNGLVQPRVTLELCLFLDQDQNGLVTEAEIQARIADGSLFPDSDAVLIELVRAGGCGEFLEPVPPPVGELTVELCTALDLDGNGVVDEQEAVGLAVDLDGSGAIDEVDYAMAFEGCAELIDPVEPTPSPTVEPTPTVPAEPMPTDPAQSTPEPTQPAPTEPAAPEPTQDAGGTQNPPKGETSYSAPKGGTTITGLPNTGAGESSGPVAGVALMVAALALGALGFWTSRRAPR